MYYKIDPKVFTLESRTTNSYGITTLLFRRKPNLQEKFEVEVFLTLKVRLWFMKHNTTKFCYDENKQVIGFFNDDNDFLEIPLQSQIRAHRSALEG